MCSSRSIAPIFPAGYWRGTDFILREPDGLLVELCQGGVDVAGVVEGVRAGSDASPRAMLKRIGLPRLGKLLGDIR